MCFYVMSLVFVKILYFLLEIFISSYLLILLGDKLDALAPGFIKDLIESMLMVASVSLEFPKWGMTPLRLGIAIEDWTWTFRDPTLWNTGYLWLPPVINPTFLDLGLPSGSWKLDIPTLVWIGTANRLCSLTLVILLLVVVNAYIIKCF